MFEWGIDSLHFSSGDTLSVECASMLIIVGPNNAGKSRALQDINALLSSPNSGTVVTNLKHFDEGTAEDLRHWLIERFPTRSNEDGDMYYVLKDEIYDLQIDGLWTYLHSRPRGETRNTTFLYQLLTTAARIQLADPTIPMRNRVFSQPTAYIHMLQINEELYHRISSEVRAAFGVDLLINTDDTQRVGFHIGTERERSSFESEEDYLAYIHRLPKLDVQGDGIRSFIGILLAAMCGKQPLLMIDEPEAFLHPKQAERLAGILAESAETLKRQVIVATHSSDIVRGAMAKSNKVAVCRLTRRDNSNSVKMLSCQTLRSTFGKPILRSRATVAGLFYSGVIVCESHSDAEFYESLVRRLEIKGKLKHPADLYFAYGGGNQEIISLVRTYQSFGVKLAAITDIDSLKERFFEDLIDTLSSDVDLVRSIPSIRSLLNSLQPLLTADKLVAQLKALVCEPAVEDTEHIRSEVARLVEPSKKWSSVKKLGVRVFENDPEKQRQISEFLAKCNAQGLFVVPYGELESWWTKENPPSKSEGKWISAALKLITEDPDSFSEAEKFILDVCSSLGVEVS